MPVVRRSTVPGVGLALAAILAAAACSAAYRGNLGPVTTELTEADIQRSGAVTAYDAVDRLARTWFRDISGNASGDVVVYLSTDQRLGSKETLREVAARDVVMMRHLKSVDAVARYGPEASGGAIVVFRR